MNSIIVPYRSHSLANIKDIPNKESDIRKAFNFRNKIQKWDKFRLSSIRLLVRTNRLSIMHMKKQSQRIIRNCKELNLRLQSHHW